ncbi:MAG TPA: TonB family protein [Allosphingosinicella sp.]
MPDPVSAAELSRRAPPDVLLGRLSLWIGSLKSNDGWLDVAVRVGDDHHLIAETSGMLIQRQDLEAFEPSLRDLAGAESGEALLRSAGGSLSIRVVRQSRAFGNRVEVGLRQSIFDQKISFGIAPQAYDGAVVGLRAVLARLAQELETARPRVPLLEPPPAWAWPARQHGGAFEASDYPPDALERGETGVVEVDYVVRETGEISDLRLVSSSGSASLDSAALTVIAERFQYDPATDAAGTPLPHKQRRKIAWLLLRDGPVVLDAAEIDLRYIVDGVGWFSVYARIGKADGGFGGSSWMTRPMEDLLRAGTALAAGVRTAQAMFNAEPFLSRLEFEVETLNSSVPARNNVWTATDGCWVRVHDLDECTFEPTELTFEALAYSPLAAAEAIYRMALPLFEANARTDYPAFAALVAAIEAARGGSRSAGEIARAAQN